MSEISPTLTDQEYCETISGWPGLCCLETIFSGDHNFEVMKLWGVIEKNHALGVELTFGHINYRSINNPIQPILEKCIIIQSWSGDVQYFALAKKVDTKNYEGLPQNINNVMSLFTALKTFEKLQICHGIGHQLDPNLLSEGAWSDICGNWHSSDCDMLGIQKRCISCVKEARNYVIVVQKTCSITVNNNNNTVEKICEYLKNNQRVNGLTDHKIVQYTK